MGFQGVFPVRSSDRGIHWIGNLRGRTNCFKQFVFVSRSDRFVDLFVGMCISSVCIVFFNIQSICDLN